VVVAAAHNDARLQLLLPLACDAVGEDVGGPIAQYGTQLPWPDTCRCVFEFVTRRDAV
jgi:hypothetical protein